MNFKDHFSGHSAQYGQFRPAYPEKLFIWLASSCTDQQTTWDCATGSGQAAASLAKHFTRVIATDASANQIGDAAQFDGISYRVAAAEDSGIDSVSVDLITVAQALHWFDIPAFAREAERVLKPEGVLAVWTYGLMNINSELDAVVEHFYSDIVGEFWPFERKMVESGYADIDMPFAEIPAPPMDMQTNWSFPELIGYLNTWSAVKAYEKANGRNPLELVHDDLEKIWGNSAAQRTVSWPLLVRVWKNAS